MSRARPGREHAARAPAVSRAGRASGDGWRPIRAASPAPQRRSAADRGPPPAPGDSTADRRGSDRQRDRQTDQTRQYH